MSNTKTNSALDLKTYFSVPGNPVTMKEMNEFWKSLSAEDKEYFRNVDLNTGLLPV